MDNTNSSLWELTPEGCLLGFSFYAGRMFLDLGEGIMCDVSHFRRMVALLIMRCFPIQSNYYYNAMLKMPIFYNSEDHVKFIHVVKNFKSLDEDIFYDHLILKDEDIYGFRWNKISYAPLHSTYLRGSGANYQLGFWTNLDPLVLKLLGGGSAPSSNGASLIDDVLY
ncbi:hypothetical protein SO802_027921 [Lithocarpus litseifolius]|uniref:Uncharacterized protein n=1 Tax=Lithocarpus litseifolius TaxID=425828 RepID=A0AAW2BR48_9ROSI